jgi:hypothetical protein
MSKTNYRDEWVGMPEFVQDKKDAYQTINVRFESEEDVKKFAELIGQKLTSKTKAIWFPKKEAPAEKMIYVENES